MVQARRLLTPSPPPPDPPPAPPPGRADALDRRRLWRGCGLEVVETRWDPSTHPLAREAWTGVAAIELIRTGSFGKGPTRARTRAVGDPTTAVFFEAREAFHVSHSSRAPNRGTTVRFTPEALEGALAALGRPVGAASRGMFGVDEGPVSAAAHAAHARLAIRLTRGDVDDVEAAELTLALVRSVMRGASARPSRCTAEDVRRALAAREFFAANFARRVTLEEAALEAGCSVWALCRAFRSAVGVSAHRHLVTLRLREAHLRIAGGAEDLTRVALGCGFSSHSHMTAAFRREFGVAPSDTRHGRL